MSMLSAPTLVKPMQLSSATRLETSAILQPLSFLCETTTVYSFNPYSPTVPVVTRLVFHQDAKLAREARCATGNGCQPLITSDDVSPKRVAHHGHEENACSKAFNVKSSPMELLGDRAGSCASSITSDDGMTVSPPNTPAESTATITTEATMLPSAYRHQTPSEASMDDCCLVVAGGKEEEEDATVDTSLSLASELRFTCIEGDVEADDRHAADVLNGERLPSYHELFSFPHFPKLPAVAPKINFDMEWISHFVKVPMFRLPATFPSEIFFGQECVKRFGDTHRLRLGCFCCELGGVVIANLLYLTCGIVPAGVDPFTQHKGLASVWLRCSEDADRVRRMWHNRLFAGPPQLGFAILCTNEVAAAVFQKRLTDSTSTSGRLKFPRRLVTAERWKIVDSSATTPAPELRNIPRGRNYKQRATPDHSKEGTSGN